MGAGSRGDVQSYVAEGKRMLPAGHALGERIHSDDGIAKAVASIGRLCGR